MAWSFTVWQTHTTMRDAATIPRLVFAAALVFAFASTHAFSVIRERPYRGQAYRRRSSVRARDSRSEPDVPLPRDWQSCPGMGVFVADYNNDGWPDVLLTGGTAERTETGWSGRRPTLFENVGGEFRVPGAIPTDAIDHRVVVSAASVDYDVDGCPDLFIVQKGE
jgi:hypothetical protein